MTNMKSLGELAYEKYRLEQQDNSYLSITDWNCLNNSAKRAWNNTASWLVTCGKKAQEASQPDNYDLVDAVRAAYPAATLLEMDGRNGRPDFCVVYDCDCVFFYLGEMDYRRTAVQTDICDNDFAAYIVADGHAMLAALQQHFGGKEDA